MIAYHDQVFETADPFKSPIPRATLQALARAANVKYKAETGKYLTKMEICVERLVVIVDGETEYSFTELL